jgi:hypothetical protein
LMQVIVLTLLDYRFKSVRGRDDGTEPAEL